MTKRHDEPESVGSVDLYQLWHIITTSYGKRISHTRNCFLKCLPKFTLSFQCWTIYTLYRSLEGIKFYVLSSFIRVSGA